MRIMDIFHFVKSSMIFLLVYLVQKGKCVCPPDWTFAMGKCYFVFAINANEKTCDWNQARNGCLKIGADLVSINSELEKDHVDIILKNAGIDVNRFYWIGLTDKDREGDFKWVDGTNITYSNWHIQEPTSLNPTNIFAAHENYVVASQQGLWNDVVVNWTVVLNGRTEPSAYVCERDSEIQEGELNYKRVFGRVTEIGATGARGLRGEQGATGLPGAVGRSGLNGVKGEPGERGLMGLPGRPGKQGKQGPRGPPGPLQRMLPEVGPQGAPGKQGPMGPIGPPGRDGPPGSTGEQGREGASGKPGEIGQPGETGARGLTGPKGERGLPGIAGEAGAKGDVGRQGPRGGTGVRGEKGLRGESGRKGDKGSNGEQGVTGAKGSPGTSGPKGQKGVQGFNGNPGNPGPQGQKGERGHTGSMGNPGQTGVTGAKGEPGRDGITGPRGPMGMTGETGPSGPPGPPGELPWLLYPTNRNNSSRTINDTGFSWKLSSSFLNATAYCQDLASGFYEHPLHCWQFISCGTLYGGLEHTCLAGRSFSLEHMECLEDPDCIFGSPSWLFAENDGSAASKFYTKTDISRVAAKFQQPEYLRHRLPSLTPYTVGMGVLFMCVSILTIAMCKLYLSSSCTSSLNPDTSYS